MTICRIHLAGLLLLLACERDKAAVTSTEASQPSQPTHPTANTPSATAQPEVKPRLDPAAAPDLCKKGDASACSAACDAGDLSSCVTFADALLEGGTRTRGRCEAPLRKACGGSIGRACSILGSRCLSSLAIDEKRNPNRIEQASLNEKACGLNDGMGCFNIAKYYEEGYGVLPNDAMYQKFLKMALQLMPKDCEASSKESCLMLGVLYDPETAKRRVPSNQTKAHGYYKKACDAGAEMACNIVKTAGD